MVRHCRIVWQRLHVLNLEHIPHYKTWNWTKLWVEDAVRWGFLMLDWSWFVTRRHKRRSTFELPVSTTTVTIDISFNITVAGYFLLILRVLLTLAECLQHSGSSCELVYSLLCCLLELHHHLLYCILSIGAYSPSEAIVLMWSSVFMIFKYNQ